MHLLGLEIKIGLMGFRFQDGGGHFRSSDCRGTKDDRKSGQWSAWASGPQWLSVKVQEHGAPTTGRCRSVNKGTTLSASASVPVRLLIYCIYLGLLPSTRQDRRACTRGSSYHSFIRHSRIQNGSGPVKWFCSSGNFILSYIIIITTLYFWSCRIKLDKN